MAPRRVSQRSFLSVSYQRPFKREVSAQNTQERISRNVAGFVNKEGEHSYQEASEGFLKEVIFMEV